MLANDLHHSTYSTCLHYEFSVEDLHVEHQVRLPVVYRGISLEAGYRIDFLVEGCVIVELKAVDRLAPLHTAQLLTYLKLSGHSVGLLINFNVPHLRQGIRRVVLGYQKPTEKKLPSASPASSVVES